MREEALERWWKWRKGKALDAQRRQQIFTWTQLAQQRMAGFSSLEDCLEQHKIHLELTQQDHCVAGVRFRARLDLHARRLTLFARALPELAVHCPDGKKLSRVLIGHEVFHLLCPECPGRLQEACAHWFTAEYNGLEDFPGLWDQS